jgi:hypothetical protein
VKQSILRWAIGSSDGARSSVWRLWGTHMGDIYAAVRSLSGIIKASFHRDGRCQLGFTSEYAPTAAARFGKQVRHWETWTLPPEPTGRVLQVLMLRQKIHPAWTISLTRRYHFQKKIFLTTSNERFLPAQQIIGGSIAAHEAGRHTDSNPLVPTIRK